jgi:histone acetyltransferase (RNA polymerase elongator complex component)
MTPMHSVRDHKNIPIFIPHMGCPHQCVFCDQRTISGHATFEENQVKDEIEAAIATLTEGAVAEIAYFGGSFTAIDRELMVRLLDVAQGYVDAGRVRGIRFSTRPDAMGEDILDILSHYTISAVELGLQSLDDRVLSLCRRGHTAAQAEDACRRIVRRGYPLVGQMMLGLPESTPKSERETAERICALGACAARVYPTVVFEGTALAVMMQKGMYSPLTNEQAAERAAVVLDIFERHGVDILRVGLCASEGLSSARAVGGANHPALGEMAYGALFRMHMMQAIEASPMSGRGETATFTVPRGKRSQAIGQRRSNAIWLTEHYGIRHLIIKESDQLTGTSVLLSE